MIVLIKIYEVNDPGRKAKIESIILLNGQRFKIKGVEMRGSEAKVGLLVESFLD